MPERRRGARGALLQRRLGEELVEMREQPYDSEDLLQTLLAEYPNLLADQLAGYPRRWLLVRHEAWVPNREAGGSHWSLDHLFIDQSSSGQQPRFGLLGIGARR